MTMARVFALVGQLRRESEVPVVFYTYYNLVFANGVEAYVKSARAAGVDGMLVLDLPPEEAGEVAAASGPACAPAPACAPDLSRRAAEVRRLSGRRHGRRAMVGGH